ncbi:MAG: TIGR02646 family protein [Chloroflexi bacterium]|nr:TIGR02646 family protein [Chloroflexota bacterium]
MRGSTKGDEPPELRDWKEEQRRNGIEPEYRNLRQPERGATEESLFAEQTGQCVYCGRGISLDRKRHYHIEHSAAVEAESTAELQLDYTNLFLSCGPEGDRGTRNTCGHHKGDWFEEECHIPPAPETCAERFGFRSSGRIAGDSSPEADKMIAMLNLNHPELVTERRVMVDAGPRLERRHRTGITGSGLPGHEPRRSPPQFRQCRDRIPDGVDRREDGRSECQGVQARGVYVRIVRS